MLELTRVDDERAIFISRHHITLMKPRSCGGLEIWVVGQSEPIIVLEDLADLRVHLDVVGKLSYAGGDA